MEMNWKELFVRGVELVNRGWLEEPQPDGTVRRPKHGKKTKYTGAALREIRADRSKR